MARLKIDSGPAIEYEVYGRGRPLLFLPGALESPEVWKPIAEHFSARYKTILINLEPRLCYKPGIRARVAEIEALVQKESSELKPFGIGFSFGALELLTYSAIYKNSLEGQILVSLLGLTPKEKVLRAFFWPFVEPLLEAAEHGYLLPILDSALCQAVKGAIGSSSQSNQERQTLSSYLKTHPTLKAYVKSLNYHRHPWLKNVKIPTYILVGEDGNSSRAYAERVLPQFGTKAELLIIPNSNHSPHLENPKQFIELLEHALEGLESLA